MAAKSAQGGYQMGFAPSVVASHAARTVHSDAAFVLPLLEPQFAVLDVGCGPGTITTGFAAYVPQGRVVGVDLGAPVIESARKLAAERTEGTPAAAVEFTVGDVIKGLPFEDESFDVVFSSQLFPHLPGPELPVTALKEMRRVCKTGGFVASRVCDAFNWYPETEGLRLWVKGLSAMIGTDRPGRKMHGYAREAGFEVAKMKIGAGVTCISEVEQRKWWAGLQAGRQESSDFRRKMIESGTTEDELKVINQALREWEEAEDGWYALIQSENVYWK